MVDPNRKINRIAERDMNFVDECESEFALRYTTDDPEFMAHCAKPESEPPLVDNWVNSSTSGGGGGSSSSYGNSSPYSNKYHGEQRRGGGGVRSWQRRGSGYNRHNSNSDRGFRDNRNNRNRYDPIPISRAGLGEHSDRPYDRPQNEQQQGGSPLKFRRDYSNFVPASKD